MRTGPWCNPDIKMSNYITPYTMSIRNETKNKRISYIAQSINKRWLTLQNWWHTLQNAKIDDKNSWKNTNPVSYDLNRTTKWSNFNRSLALMSSRAHLQKTVRIRNEKNRKGSWNPWIKYCHGKKMSPNLVFGNLKIHGSSVRECIRVRENCICVITIYVRCVLNYIELTFVHHFYFFKPVYLSFPKFA